MSETIISKRCNHCKTIKPLSDFHKDKSKEDNHRNTCKICSIKQSIKYFKTERGKKIQKLYRQTEKAQAYQSLYEKSDKGKANHLATVKRYNKRFPLRIRARDAVKYATSVGNLPKSKTLQCYLCFKPAHQYHHYLGYEPKHKLDVLPLCIKCHKIQDSLISVNSYI